MKIRLEKGTLAAVVLGTVGVGGTGLYIAYLLITSPFSFDAVGLLLLALVAIVFIYIGIFFLKLPMLTIAFNEKSQEFIVPYWGPYTKTWNGNPGLFLMYLSALFFYRKRISISTVKYVIVCHQYGGTSGLLQKLESDSQAKTKISEYLGSSLSPGSSKQIIEGGIARGVGEGISSGNILEGGVSGIAGGVAGSIVLGDAVKNNYLIGIRTTDSLLLFSIGYERRTSDCAPFASFLSAQNIKVIT